MAVLQPEGQELASCRVAAQHHAVPLGCVAVVLHPQVVLVGVEVRELGVRRVLAQHVARRGLALVQGVGPVLHPNSPVVSGVPGRGDVARGKDIGSAGPQELVDDDAVLNAQPGGTRQLVSRGRAHPDDHEVALDHQAVIGPHALCGAGAHDLGHLGGQVKVDAVLPVQVTVDASDLHSEDPFQRHGLRRHDRHLRAQLARGGGNLGADPAGADDDDPAGRADL